jgi:transcriptional regulator with XRE-family HTH domain
MKRPSSLKRHRKQAGTWLKGLREQAGLTQLELADRLGFKYYSFVSQVENGFGRLPNEKMEAWARTVGVDPSHFAKKLISFYEPELHRLLYEAKSRHSKVLSLYRNQRAP